ncbi:MAG: methyltransferase domain-containing protein [bacterium]|nr:methyltransferase domain-containing protein [bacterium]
MRRDTASLVRCPRCEAEGQCTVQVQIEDAVEVVSGILVCGACGAEFSIERGCCDLIVSPTDAVQSEQDAQGRIESEGRRDALARGDDPDDIDALRTFVQGLPDGYADTEEHAPAVRDVIERLAPQPGETVLDLGAGNGWTTAMLADRGCHAVASDVSTLYLPRGRFFAEAGRVFDRVLADMTTIPLVSNGFDAVFANSAIHHSADLAKTAREIARVLKPGGRGAFVNEPVVGPFERRRRERFGRIEREQGFNENVYDTREWRAAFTAAGLDVRFTIADAGIEEKVRRRMDRPEYASPLKQAALTLLARRGLRNACLGGLRAPLLWFYPFNVVIWLRKRT